jgi:ribonuclease BN (tRNA processing enzyme)
MMQKFLPNWKMLPNEIPLFIGKKILGDIKSVQNIIENAINILISHYHGDLHVSHAKNFQFCVIS